jgi:ADP-heptose:LPS heptosyltransferase
MNKLRMLSLCSGIGGADLAAEWTDGIETVGFVEINPFCQQVLAKHWPGVKCLSNIKEVIGNEFGPVDLPSKYHDASTRGENLISTCHRALPLASPESQEKTGTRSMYGHTELLTRLSQPPSKVILLCENRLGSFICSTPAIRALRTALPTAELVAVADEDLRTLVSRSPHLNRFVAAPPLEPSCHAQNARRLTQFFLHMQDEEFDLGIQMNGYGLQSSPYFLLFGAQVNAGFVGHADIPGMMDAALPFPQEGHIIDRFLALSAFLGAPAQGRTCEFPLLPEDEAETHLLLESLPRPLIGLHPGARSEQRRWEPARFAEVAIHLQQRFGGTTIILGDTHDYCNAERIAQKIGRHCLNLAGKTSLPVLGAIIQELSVLIADDSGPAHIAYTVEIPTVTLFASATRTPFWPPEHPSFRPLTCSQVASSPFQRNWLDTISVQQVVTSASEILC